MYNLLNILQLILAVPLCYLLTKGIIDVAQKSGFLNHPNPIVENHKTPTAYGGGISIGLTLILFLSFQITQHIYAYKYLVLIISFLLIGQSDDIFKFDPLKKFISQLITLIPFVIFYSDVWFIHLVIFSSLIILSQNAWNLLDIMDGLTAGVSIVVFFSMSLIVTLSDNHLFISLLTAIIAMSLIGFRFWNRYPAKIFLGEAGTILLGSLFALIVINVYMDDPVTGLFLLLLGLIPFFELIFLIVVRTRKQIPFYRGSPDHFALRMLNRGMTVLSINKRVILFSIVNSLIVIIASTTKSYIAFIVCLSFELLIAVLAFVYFQSLPAKTD